MPLRIRQKIRETNKKIMLDKSLGHEIGIQAMKVIFEGHALGSSEWRTLMEFYADPETPELKRLCGDDTEFMKLDWGRRCIAYIAGDCACGSETITTGGALRSILDRDRVTSTDDMWNTIDATGPELQRLLAIRKEELSREAATEDADRGQSD